MLSGNRNFEGRINPDVKANYLASPPLVVAYALAGTMDIDLTTEPLGTDGDGRPVMLSEIWPTQEEVGGARGRRSAATMFRQTYGNVFDGNPTWNAMRGAGGRPLRLQGRVHLHPGAAVLPGPHAGRRCR